MNIQQSFAFLSVSPPDSLAVCVEPAGSPELQAPCSSATCVEGKRRVKSLEATQTGLQALMFIWNSQRVQGVSCTSVQNM